MASSPTTPKTTTSVPSDFLLTLIPSSWREALDRVRALFPGAMIAGGALRDLDNGRPVKDIDVFIPDCADLASVHAAIQSLTTGNLKVLSSENRVSPEGRVYEAWAATDVLGIFDLDFAGLELQIIALSCGADAILPRIDFGLCRIAFDGERIIRTEEYLADQRNAKFTLHRCDDTSQYDRSIRRWERFREKYIGWPMDVADRFKSECGKHNDFEGCFCGFDVPFS